MVLLDALLFIDLLFLKIRVHAKKKKKWWCFEKCSIQEFKFITLKTQKVIRKEIQKVRKVRKT